MHFHIFPFCSTIIPPSYFWGWGIQNAICKVHLCYGQNNVSDRVVIYSYDVYGLLVLSPLHNDRFICDFEHSFASGISSPCSLVQIHSWPGLQWNWYDAALQPRDLNGRLLEASPSYTFCTLSHLRMLPLIDIWQCSDISVPDLFILHWYMCITFHFICISGLMVPFWGHTRPVYCTCFL